MDGDGRRPRSPRPGCRPRRPPTRPATRPSGRRTGRRGRCGRRRRGGRRRRRRGRRPRRRSRRGAPRPPRGPGRGAARRGRRRAEPPAPTGRSLENAVGTPGRQERGERQEAPGPLVAEAGPVRRPRPGQELRLDDGRGARTPARRPTSAASRSIACSTRWTAPGRRRRGLERVEHGDDGRVADRVDRRRPAGRGGAGHPPRERRRLVDRPARVAGVRVRLAQPGRPGRERAVGLQLDVGEAGPPARGRRQERARGPRASGPGRPAPVPAGRGPA